MQSKTQNSEPKTGAQRLRWGVLGTARIADAQVTAIRLSSNGELRAIASRDLALAQDWASRRDVPLAFGSYEEMLASDEIDAVYIPLPNSLHKEWSIRAAQNGKHVLCEKPLAANADEVREMIAAAEANGVKLMEAFMYRFHPQIGHLRQLLADNAIGQATMSRAMFGFYLDRPNDVRWSKELAGGALMDVGCYCVNISRLAAGADPVAVSASAAWAGYPLGPERGTGVDASLSGLLEFPGGLLATVECSFQTGPKSSMYQEFSVFGTQGRIRLDDPFRVDAGNITVAVEKGGDDQTVSVPDADSYHLMVEHFADAVLNNRPLDYPPQNSLGNMLVIDALYESARTGRKVEIEK
jgi:D-xylose 1-dehydrogenase (NADP+, D-xylono-1,5-lactone-forming)